MKKYLLIFAFIIFLSPLSASAITCSAWFSPATITAGQQSVLNFSWSNSLTPQIVACITPTRAGHAYLPGGYFECDYFSNNTGSGSASITWDPMYATTNFQLDVGEVVSAGGDSETFCSATINVISDPCPTAIESYWGSGTYLLRAGATRRINFSGQNYCISNSSGYNYFVPGKTAAEINSFTNAIPCLSGLTRF